MENRSLKSSCSQQVDNKDKVSTRDKNVLIWYQNTAVPCEAFKAQYLQQNLDIVKGH